GRPLVAGLDHVGRRLDLHRRLRAPGQQLPTPCRARAESHSRLREGPALFGVDMGEDTHAVHARRSNMTTKILRRLGALTLLIVGGVHLQQYLAGYSSVPTIGTLFILNAIGAAVVAICLLAPIERLLGDRQGSL